MRSCRAALVVSAFSVVVLAACAEHVHDTDKSAGWAYRAGSALELIVRPHPAQGAADGGAPVVGTWVGDGTFAEPPLYSQRYYAMEIRNDATGGVSRRTEVRSLDDVEGLPTAAKEYDERHMAMRLRRDAGVIVLEGEKEGKHAEGDVRFEKDADYTAIVTALAGRDVETSELASLALANVKRVDIEDLRSAGLTMTPVELIKMHDSGVTGKFMRELSASGREFTLADAIRLKNSGVTTEYVANMRKAGLSPSVEELIRLKNSDVSSGFVKAIATAEGVLPPVDEIIRLRNSGVSSKYIGDLRAAGYNLTTEEFIRLSGSTVSADYARGIKEAGYELSVDELIKLRQTGVSTQYVKALQEPGYEKMSIDQIIEAKNKGLSADFVKKLRKRG